MWCDLFTIWFSNSKSLKSETNSTTKQYTGKFVDSIFVYIRNFFQVNEELGTPFGWLYQHFGYFEFHVMTLQLICLESTQKWYFVLKVCLCAY